MNSFRPRSCAGDQPSWRPPQCVGRRPRLAGARRWPGATACGAQVWPWRGREVALSFPLARPFLAHPAGCCSSRGRQSRGESIVGEQEGGAGCRRDPCQPGFFFFFFPGVVAGHCVVLCKGSWMAQTLALPTRTGAGGPSSVGSSLGTSTQSFPSVSPEECHLAGYQLRRATICAPC